MIICCVFSCFVVIYARDSWVKIEVSIHFKVFFFLQALLKKCNPFFCPLLPFQMLTLLCRVKIKSEIFKVDGKTSFYIIFYFKIMSQLWDTRFNEGGRHQSNSSVAVFSLSVNFNDNGSDLFIFSLPSPAVLFSACQRNGIWCPLKRLFMKPQICVLRNIFDIENNCGREPG